MNGKHLLRAVFAAGVALWHMAATAAGEGVATTANREPALAP